MARSHVLAELRLVAQPVSRARQTWVRIHATYGWGHCGWAHWVVDYHQEVLSPDSRGRSWASRWSVDPEGGVVLRMWTEGPTVTVPSGRLGVYGAERALRAAAVACLLALVPVLAQAAGADGPAASRPAGGEATQAARTPGTASGAYARPQPTESVGVPPVPTAVVGVPPIPTAAPTRSASAATPVPTVPPVPTRCLAKPALQTPSPAPAASSSDERTSAGSATPTGAAAAGVTGQHPDSAAVLPESDSLQPASRAHAEFVEARVPRDEASDRRASGEPEWGVGSAPGQPAMLPRSGGLPAQSLLAAVVVAAFVAALLSVRRGVRNWPEAPAGTADERLRTYDNPGLTFVAPASRVGKRFWV